MVEVFKTDVREETRAKQLIKVIHNTFSHLEANFDLEDCDNILRMESRGCVVESLAIVEFLRGLGVNAEVLPDAVPLQTQKNY